MVLREVNAPFTEDFRNSSFSTLNAIWDAYSSVATASKGETRDLGTTAFDQFDTLKVPECVLGHAEVPSENSRKERFCKGVKAQNILKLGEYCLNELLVRTL
jgi:hypothetical protein